jgi:hypothetical protein
MVRAGERVEIGEGEAAPGRAQDAEPCDVVHGVEQGADQRHEIEEFLTLGQGFDFNGAEGDAAAAQKRRDVGEVAAIAYEDGDAVLGIVLASLIDSMLMRVDDIGNELGFAILEVEFAGSGKVFVACVEELGDDPKGGTVDGFELGAGGCGAGEGDG